MQDYRVSKSIWRLPSILAVILCVLFAVSESTAASANNAPRVVTSIAPIHALASAVMDGIGAPHLLLPPGANAHGYALRPSDARALANADFVFWIGANLERFLDKPLKGLARRARNVRLSIYADRLPVRKVGAWEGHDEHGHNEQEMDPHVWLDPENAKRMATEIARQLSTADTRNSAVYKRNVAALVNSIDQAVRDVEQILAPVKLIPYVVFHDAYQYFEARFGMNAVGSIMINPERPPGAGRLSDVRRKIQKTGAACVFHEPQFKSKLVETVIRGGTAKSAPLDPVGAAIPTGPRAYQQLLLSLARQLRACLSR